MRAKQGSQIPKFITGGWLNQYNIGSFIPQNKPSANFKLQSPVSQKTQVQQQNELMYNQLLQNTLNKNNTQIGSQIDSYTDTQTDAQTGTSTNNIQKPLNKSNIGSAIGQGADMISNMFAFDKDGYQGKYGHLQQAGDQAFDQAANAVMAINPLVGGIMKAGGLVSDVLTTYGGMGTDSMTKTDAVLGSKLLSLTPIGMINGFAGKKTKEFGINQNTINQIGNSYGGSVSNIMDADSKANKKYGLFSSSSRKKANRLIDKMNIQQYIMTDIADNVRDKQAMAGNDFNYLNYNFNLSGGYDQRYMRAAKSGMKLQDKISLIKQRRTINNFINLDTKEVDWEPVITEFKEGGNLPELWEPIIEDTWEPIITDYIEEFKDGGKVKQSFETWFNSIPKNCRADGYDYKKAYEIFDWELLSNHAKDPDKYHLYSVSPIPDENGNYPFLKLGKIENNPEIKGEFDWYNSKEGAEHKSKFDIQFINDRYYYVPKKFKDGGKAKEELETPEIEETNQKNLIPEGALHKNKHHMEHTEGLTQKGIPVIDNDGEQQAEIELDEIIFTLEVTKKLEELYKEGTNEAAIEAGKLLVKEILFNTDDRTGLITKCQEGGKL